MDVNPGPDVRWRGGTERENEEQGNLKIRKDTREGPRMTIWIRNQWRVGEENVRKKKRSKEDFSKLGKPHKKPCVYGKRSKEKSKEGTREEGREKKRIRETEGERERERDRKRERERERKWSNRVAARLMTADYGSVPLFVSHWNDARSCFWMCMYVCACGSVFPHKCESLGPYRYRVVNGFLSRFTGFYWVFTASSSIPSVTEADWISWCLSSLFKFFFSRLRLDEGAPNRVGGKYLR